MKCVFVVTGFCLIIVSAAAQDVSVVRIEPDPLQQLPCPQQKIEFRCQILVPSFAMEWTLPTNETLEFGHAENIGAVYVSSDDAYSATLTNRTEDPNSANRFFFTSTLLVMEPVNGSNLTCVAVSGGVPVKESTSIILSGTPDPPKNLGYNDRVVIESSVDLQWTRPSYTGGVAVVNYTVSANGKRLEVANSSQIVRFNTSYLIYGEVLVLAINTCGQENQPAAINIPAAAPLPLSNLSVALNCEADSSPWTIIWMNGQREEGVVYPDVELSVKLTRTDELASNVTESDPCSEVTAADTSCTVTLPRGIYNVTVTQSNDVGSSVDSNLFDTRRLIVEAMLGDEKPLSVTVTVNIYCKITCPAIVMFGTQPISGGSCDIQANTTSEELLSAGNNATFSVDTGSIARASDERYCYHINYCEQDDNGGSGDGLSTGGVIGVVFSCVVGIGALVVLLIFVMVYWRRSSSIFKSTPCFDGTENADIDLGHQAQEQLSYAENNFTAPANPAPPNEPQDFGQDTPSFEATNVYQDTCDTSQEIDTTVDHTELATIED
jgi:hypothetical protein